VSGRSTLADLRLIVITDRELARPHALEDVLHAALEAGAPAIQLRDKQATARELYEQALELRTLTRRFGARLFINDRLDVALAAGADGVHLGPGDLPVAAARHAARAPFLIGFSADDPAIARVAIAAGADYIGCGAVFATASKDEAAGEQIGTAGLAAMVRASDAPVIAIGGIGPRNVAAVAATGAAGCAAIGAIMTAPDPAAAVQQLLAAFSAHSAAG
jgi:thiamine-phosphate pyrophosphorylase